MPKVQPEVRPVVVVVMLVDFGMAGFIAGRGCAVITGIGELVTRSLDIQRALVNDP